MSRVDGVFTRQRRHDAVFMITREARRRRSHAGTLSRDEILTAVREDKRVLGFLRECKEAVLRDLLVPEKLEASLEEMDADKSGAVWKSTSASDAAVLAPSSGEEPASPRRRAGGASMAWRSTR